jgi:hypothetical protein
MLAIPMSGLESEVKAASEEHCVCDPDWFGCVVILSVRVGGATPLTKKPTDTSRTDKKPVHTNPVHTNPFVFWFLALFLKVT